MIILPRRNSARDLTLKEKQMNDETSKELRNKGIAMMAHGYT